MTQAKTITPADLAHCDERMVKVFGTARSGKTEALIQRVAALLQAGVAPERILVETSSNFAADAFRARLARVHSEGAQEVCITTAQQACVDVLSTPVAQASTGRVPRILNSGERIFFLEDMKTLGQKRRRMRTMLDFFFAQWAMLEPEEKWALAGEETDLLAYTRSFLQSRGGMLPEEAAYVAARFLQSEDGKGACHAFDYVLCDDFQNLSHAQQTVLCLLAIKQLIVAGNTHETLHLNNPNPYPEGFANFDTLRHNVCVFKLGTPFGNEEIAQAAQELAKRDTAPANHAEDDLELAISGDAAEAAPHTSGLVSVKWQRAEDEISDLTRAMRVIADAKAYTDGDIAVIVPNRRWAHLAAAALKMRGFTCNDAGLAGGLAGDPRDEEKGAGIKAHTLLNLLADEKDMVAWRSLCGIGNYLTNSDAWLHLGEYATEHNVSLYDALEEVSNKIAQGGEAPFLRAEVLAKHFQEGQEFIAKNAGRKGFALISTIGADKLPQFSCVRDAMCGEETAAELFEMQQRATIDPYLPQRCNAVRITYAENFCGQEAKMICVMGAVDGFYPKRDAFEIVSTDEERARILEADRRSFYSAITKATELLVLSYFSKADLELAEKTKMQVVRVKSEHDARVALVRPSQFVTEAQSTLGGEIGGQQFIAELGL